MTKILIMGFGTVTVPDDHAVLERIRLGQVPYRIIKDEHPKEGK